ncbi:DUF4317 family protein [Ileibacterium valens]|uniref:DUF4317 domain-containing protein n=1 Tax=Ileibacterium valens TaxID=1862668 RepID=A0A1U7NEW1_9FIRM|nr:DUF4317 family protein [Ileibacterium valens]OLU38346.1 hypothetical protein BO222_08600 [Ileibacterium valens]OLU38492.1 hypothetical protein BO224_08930 [Erysipelotrichaceae bacterium NYU-BL-E8]OLU38525.1 hypothetical protein BM735_09245 [Erysipelotrichaceae bacterium NYU-BL-F16]
MNNEELKEIRRQYKKKNKNFNIYRVAYSYVIPAIPETQIPSFEIKDWEDFREAEQEIFLSIFKKALSGKIGKNLMEYEFEREAGQENGYQKKLYTLNKSLLKDEELVTKLRDEIIANDGFNQKHLITIASCEYLVPVLDKNGEVIPDSAPMPFQFLLGCINEVDLTDIGLFYNPDTANMEKKIDEDMHVLPKVLDGFMFPVFADRGADISRLLYFTAKPKEPNDGLIEVLCGREAELPYDREQQNFAGLISDLAQDELSLQLIQNLQENVREMISENPDSEAFSLSKNEMENLLSNSGISEQKMDRFSAVYDNQVGKEELKAVNMIDTSKLAVKMNGITVNVKGDVSDKVKTQVVDGKRYLMIEVDEGLIVNGIDMIK